MTVAEGPALPAGFHLVVLDAVGSTNDEAKRRGQAGAPDGTVIQARRQLAGRGRHGRLWHSPEGNLYCSIVLRPETSAVLAAQLSFVAALALDQAFAELLPGAVERRLKWPNDVMLNGAKCAGILLEAETGFAGELAFLVLGIGINIVSHPEPADRPTISLRQLGSECTPDDVLEALLPSFAAWRQRWIEGGFDAIRTAWLERSFPAGAPITVRLPRERVEGGFAGMDATGSLLVDVGLPSPRRFAAGDVFFG